MRRLLPLLLLAACSDPAPSMPDAGAAPDAMPAPPTSELTGPPWLVCVWYPTDPDAPSCGEQLYGSTEECGLAVEPCSDQELLESTGCLAERGCEAGCLPECVEE